MPSKLNSTSVPSVMVTRVTIALVNSSPRNSACPADVPTGTKNLPKLVLPLKYSMLVVLGTWTLRKMAPKPRLAAGAGVVAGSLANTKLKSMVLSLNMANVLVGLKARKRFVTVGLTVENVDASVAEAGPLTA